MYFTAEERRRRKDGGYLNVVSSKNNLERRLVLGDVLGWRLSELDLT